MTKKLCQSFVNYYSLYFIFNTINIINYFELSDIIKFHIKKRKQHIYYIKMSVTLHMALSRNISQAQSDSNF